MKTRAQLTPEKLRGGYYTPPALVGFCWRRAASLCRRAGIDVLEPSAGDGAFFRSLPSSIRDRVRSVTAVEIDEAEAAKARQILHMANMNSKVVAASFLAWSRGNQSDFDVVVGNPPFLRYQFVSKDDVESSEMLFSDLGLRFEGVSNLWIPILVGSLAKLRPGGSASIVVPAELFTGMTAGLVREWLLQHMDELSVDLFPSGKFPGVLQEVVVLSGVMRQTPSMSPRIRVVNHDARRDSAQDLTIDLSASRRPWTHLLLPPAQLGALEEALALPEFVPLASAARLQVSIVTGANDYFSVDTDEMSRHGLERWGVPLLPRARHVDGLIWTKADQSSIGTGVKSWLLDFSEERPSPLKYRRSARYIEEGVAQGLPERYKCRIREPWYRVPEIWAGSLMLSKRSHRFPRLVLNSARSFTTDTIYRGRMTPSFRGRERDLVAGFHNSVTLLTAELEGRSFGGGVHELVPSEVGRIAVPMVDDLGVRLSGLDKLTRAAGAQTETLIEETDKLVLSGRIPDRTINLLRDAREHLMTRRLERGSSSYELGGSGLLAG